MTTDVTLGIAILGGMAYFFSPCVWPLYPAYLAYLGGAPDEAGADGGRAVATRLVNACGFVLGLGLVFVSLGATLSGVGQLIAFYRPLLEKVAGLLIVVFGLQMLGRLRLPLLEREWRLPWQPGRPGFAAGVLMGAAFGLGWTPCVGPVLASILLLASQTTTVREGMLLLAAFTAGFAVPFLLLATLIGWVGPQWLRGRGAALERVQQASGALLVALGLLVFTGQLARISAWLWNTLS
ncbi:MAG: cytochrome C biogenesis protein [Bacillota bacterium]|nr:MAG: cytochrome C biogenesis protein [Bacillota bacterium]